MIQSIFGPRKSIISPSAVASLSIELLPEFGWSVGKNNEKAFGPGTLFQGDFFFLQLKLNEVTKIRLINMLSLF